MKERINLLLSNIKRLISNEEILYRAYLVLTVAAVVFVGLFGIIPASKNTVSNLKLVMEMNKTNKMLSNKVIELKKAEESLNNVGNNVFFLENYLPENFNIQNYMVDFVFAAGDADFVVSRITPIKEKNGSVDIYVSMLGTRDLVKLINILESLNRVSEIQEIRVTKGLEYNTLSMTLRTFIMEKQ